MRLARPRSTIRRLMAAVAMVGVALAWAVDRAKRGDPPVDFTYPQALGDEPLAHPTRVLAIEGDDYTLEDGRVIRLDEGPFRSGRIGIEDPGRTDSVLDVEVGADGAVVAHMLQAPWSCGNCSRPGLPPIRLPLIPRPTYRKRRKLVGTGTLVRDRSEAGRRATRAIDPAAPPRTPAVKPPP